MLDSEALTLLEHENIIKCIEARRGYYVKNKDFIEVVTVVYLVLERAPYGELFDFINVMKIEQLDESFARFIFKKLLDTL